MDRDTAISKIKKCLALSRSGNPHEAAAALRQAQALMREHDIDDEQLQLADVDERGAPVRMASVPHWEAHLARTVATAFGCEMLLVRGLRIGGGRRTTVNEFRFVGVGAAAELAAYAQDVLSRQCARARLRHIAEQPRRCKSITKTARGDAFALAWVLGCERQLERFTGTERHTELLKQYMRQQHPDLSTHKPKQRALSRSVKDDSWVQGHAAGKAAQLQHAMSGSGPQQRLSFTLAPR